MQSVIGTLLNGRFRLEEQIGSGGMSTVYRAFDPTLERWVAIKLMHRDMSADPDQLERFRREARAVARLSHPHVVTVIDFGEDDGTPFIVLEYVEGETLKERIRRMKRLPIGEAVAYGIEIGRALSAAHAESLVHRDVKPQNVLVDQEGRAKVTDFGIARSLEAHGLTATGRVLGTTDYVSPEQALGHPVTQQSDVYSLGIVLYEMLTGDAPFKADTQVAVAMKHVREPIPDAQKLRPEISAALAAVIEHATAKETRNRYATADEMVHDLEQVLAIEAARAGETSGEATTVLRALGDTADVAPVRLRRPGRVTVLSALAIGLIGGLIAWFATRTEPGPGPPAVPQQKDLEQVRFTSRDAAEDYDPQGDQEEHGDQTQNVIDGLPNTLWSTEQYETTIEAAGGGKVGVGIYVHTPSAVAARRLVLTTPILGWTTRIYAANEGAPPEIEGWTPVSDQTKITEDDQRIPLDTGGREFEYYLIWIVDPLPEGGKVEIAELSLFR